MKLLLFLDMTIDIKPLIDTGDVQINIESILLLFLNWSLTQQSQSFHSFLFGLFTDAAFYILFTVKHLSRRLANYLHSVLRFKTHRALIHPPHVHMTWCLIN
jgi:hypothetical protein